MTAEEERAYVLQTFQESMKVYQNKRIALYGLGVNSEHLVKHQQGYQLVALLDPQRIGELCWGLPVISADKAVEQVDVIVIVAKQTSVPIIYQRIARLEEQGIEIVDIAARKILDRSAEELDKHPYWKQNLEELLEEIDKHEVITFDIFDTLLMRSVLKPSDIFEMVGKLWTEQHPEQKADFASLRMKAEKKVGAADGCFHYEQIYDFINEMGIYSEEQLSELKELEYRTEQKLLSPRADMVKALEYAWNAGKRVYLISDMYFSEEQIRLFLEQNGITHYHGLLVSSDAGCSKWPEGTLFKKAAEVFGLEIASVLHIGDNESADGECSKKAGFDSYLIWSAYHMLEMSTLRRLLVNVKTLEDSCLLGIWMEHFLNSPFALHKMQGHLHIQSEYEVGFAGFGAIITAFMHRLIKVHQGKLQEKILFLARDGYLLEKLYRRILLDRNITDAPEGIYVLASRRALAVPAIDTAEELEEQLQRIRVDALAGEFLELRFGVKPEEKDAEADLVLEAEKLRKYLRKYTSQIIARAKRERKDYLLYLESLGIDREKDTHILIDSQTSGTSAYYWRKFIQKETKMEAILLRALSNWSLYDPGKDRGFLGEDNEFLKKRAYSRALELNDCILVAPIGQFMYIQEKEPVFSDAERLDKWNVMENAQHAIMDFCIRYNSLASWNLKLQEFSPDFLDDFIKILLDEATVKEVVKDSFMIKDLFVKNIEYRAFE